MRLHYSADMDRGPQWVAQERKKYSTQGAWEREQEIIHEAGGGERVFADVLGRWDDRIIIDSSEFQPSPHWKLIAGFDHGKANPTAALVGCVDFDGNLYMLAEYYQPGLSPRQHCPQLEKLRGFMRAEVVADPSIFYSKLFLSCTRKRESPTWRRRRKTARFWAWSASSPTGLTWRTANLR